VHLLCSYEGIPLKRAVGAQMSLMAPNSNGNGSCRDRSVQAIWHDTAALSVEWLQRSHCCESCYWLNSIVSIWRTTAPNFSCFPAQPMDSASLVGAADACGSCVVDKLPASAIVRRPPYSQGIIQILVFLPSKSTQMQIRIMLSEFVYQTSSTTYIWLTNCFR
jgi:hypothetical protein